jgi:tetratricopeptide (TPR) repeat protein
LDPAFVYAHYNLGNAYYRNGELDAAIAAYREVIVLKPTFAYAHNNLGTAYEKKGRLDAAMAQYNKALALDAGYALAYYNVGNVLRLKGDLTRAIFHYEKAVAFSSHERRFHHGLASALLADSQWEAAKSVLHNALVLFPGDGTLKQMLQKFSQGRAGRGKRKE